MDREEHLQWCKDRALEYLPGKPSPSLRKYGIRYEKT